MFILSLLSTVFPFILKFLGTNAVDKVIAYKQAQMESATELEKAKLNADIEALKRENERKAMVRDLQIKEYEHPFLWWPKFLLSMSVCVYWSLKFAVKFIGLDDFGIQIADLSEEEAYVSGMVLAYLYIDHTIKTWRRG